MEFADFTWVWWIIWIIVLLLLFLLLRVIIHKYQASSSKIGWGCCAAYVIYIMLGVFVSMPICYATYFDYSSSIEKAISRQDFAKAHKKLDMQYKTIQNRGGDEDAMEESYVPYAIKLFNAELNYLMADDSRRNVDRVITLIGDFRIQGTPVVGVTNVKNVIRSNERYMKSVSRYNTTLDGVLARAIAQGNQYLAESILPLYKPNLRKTLYDSHVFSADEYSFEFTNEAREHAEEVYYKAVKEKKFSKK